MSSRCFKRALKWDTNVIQLLNTRQHWQKVCSKHPTTVVFKYQHTWIVFSCLLGQSISIRWSELCRVHKSFFCILQNNRTIKVKEANSIEIKLHFELLKKTFVSETCFKRTIKKHLMDCWKPKKKLCSSSVSFVWYSHRAFMGIYFVLWFFIASFIRWFDCDPWKPDFWIMKMGFFLQSLPIFNILYLKAIENYAWII